MATLPHQLTSKAQFTLKPQVPQTIRNPVKIQATETKSLIEILLHEIIQIAAYKTHHLLQTDSVLKPQQNCTWLIRHLLHPDTVVRRLAACLLGLLFEQKSDLIFYETLRMFKHVCLVRNKFFLTKISPAIRNSRPEPLYHVKKALMYYLPASTFPRGLTCYLDEPKLKCILISKEYLRLPDPQEQIIWMQFPDELSMNNDINETSESIVSDCNNSDPRTPILSKEPYNPPYTDSPSKVSVLSPETCPPYSVTFGSERHVRGSRKSTNREKEARAEKSRENSIKPAGGVHRIKCFQFFRKQKEPQIQSFPEVASMGSFLEPDSTICRSLSRLDVLPPQFESVNDWATDKDNTFVMAYHKYIPEKELGFKKAEPSFNGDQDQSAKALNNIPFIADFELLQEYLQLEGNLLASKTSNSQLDAEDSVGQQRWKKGSDIRSASTQSAEKRTNPGGSTFQIKRLASRALLQRQPWSSNQQKSLQFIPKSATSSEQPLLVTKSKLTQDNQSQIPSNGPRLFRFGSTENVAKNQVFRSMSPKRKDHTPLVSVSFGRPLLDGVIRPPQIHRIRK